MNQNCSQNSVSWAQKSPKCVCGPPDPIAGFRGLLRGGRGGKGMGEEGMEGKGRGEEGEGEGMGRGGSLTP